MTSNKKLILDISASAVQMLITQLSGAVIFYLLSLYLDKPGIGAISWSLAILMILFAVLGCGLDQIAVKKIAIGANPGRLLSTYFFHVLITGLITLLLLVILLSLLPGGKENHPLFLSLAISQCLLYFSTPFKQLANGKEQFRILLFMSVTANILRVAGLLLFIITHSLSIPNILWLYIGSSFLELALCIYYYTAWFRLPLRVSFRIKRYTLLLKESVPQLGVVICNTIISRIDWVLLGILTSATAVAEYSFAYKFFELSTLPLLVAGPLLLPRIARMVVNKPGIELQNNQSLLALLRLELAIAVFIALAVNICWVPVIDFITHGKYGSSNITVTFILSLCAPFLYINNILWSVSFAQGRLQSIFYVFFLACGINILADLVLIPLFQSNGAAVGFAITIVVQTFLYLRKTSLQSAYSAIIHLIILAVYAFIAGFLASRFFTNTWMQLLTAAFIYMLLLVGTRQVKPIDTLFIKRMAGV